MLVPCAAANVAVNFVEWHAYTNPWVLCELTGFYWARRFLRAFWLFQLCSCGVMHNAKVCVTHTLTDLWRRTLATSWWINRLFVHGHDVSSWLPGPWRVWPSWAFFRFYRKIQVAKLANCMMRETKSVSYYGLPMAASPSPNSVTVTHAAREKKDHICFWAIRFSTPAVD